MLSAQKGEPKWMVDLANSTEKNDAQHYWASFVGTMGITWITYEITDNNTLSPIIGGLTMFAVGWLKEDIYDGMMKKGIKSGGDKFMNGLGDIGGMFAGRVLIDIHEKKYYSMKQFEEKKHILD